MTYIIVGGSSGLGRALAEKFAAGGHELVLVSRDSRDTLAISNHIAVVYGVKVSTLSLDLGAGHTAYREIDHVLEQHTPLKGILLPLGANADEDCVGLSDETLRYIMQVNFATPCMLINYFLPLLEKNSGVIVGFGSVATARGRSRNAAYAAAKNALQSYFESLAHYASSRSITCQFYVLGYLDTNLAFAQKLLFPLANPDRIASRVFKWQHSNGIRFLPRPWYFVYRIVQFLPWAIFKRLDF